MRPRLTTSHLIAPLHVAAIITVNSPHFSVKKKVLMAKIVDLLLSADRNRLGACMHACAVLVSKAPERKQARTGCGSLAWARAAATASARPRSPAWDCGLCTLTDKYDISMRTGPCVQHSCLAPQVVKCMAESARACTCARLLPLVSTPRCLAQAAANATAQALSLQQRRAHHGRLLVYGAGACTVQGLLWREEAWRT